MKGKCPRCGKPSVGGTSGSRCRACLNKLNAHRKDPDHYEHYDKMASDSRRRQRGGKNSKQKAKHSGLGSTQEIKKKIKEGYKKYGKGTILSPDRRDNNRGYASSNVRMVPKNLNRGRHHVDPKKLHEWQSRVKKSNIDINTLQKAVIQNAYDKGLSEIAIAIEIKNFIKKLLKD